MRTSSFWKESTPAASSLQSKKMRSSALCLLHAGQWEADAVSYLHEAPSNLQNCNIDFTWDACIFFVCTTVVCTYIIVLHVYVLLDLLIQNRDPHFLYFRPVPPNLKQIRRQLLQTLQSTRHMVWADASESVLDKPKPLVVIVPDCALVACSKATCLSASTTTIYMLLGTAHRAFVSVSAQIDHVGQPALLPVELKDICWCARALMHFVSWMSMDSFGTCMAEVFCFTAAWYKAHKVDYPAGYGQVNYNDEIYIQTTMQKHKYIYIHMYVM